MSTTTQYESKTFGTIFKNGLAFLLHVHMSL